MDANTINAGMETLNNISKFAANISAKNNQKTDEKKEENMNNQPHSQTVEVKVGETGEVRKPLILKEKSETHIHKVFPDNRELNERECEIEKIRLNNEHELKMRELDFRIEQENALREERREKEEYARKEREKKQEAERKLRRRVLIGAGAVALAGLGFTAYDIYTGARRSKINRVSLQQPEGVTIHLNDEEGKVQ